jgi:hypothetical protein
MIFNFAILCKVHFSFKKWRKSILKTDSAKLFLLANAGAHSKRDVVRNHVGALPYVPYPRQARMPRRRSDHRLLRYVGMNSPVMFVASGPCQVAPIHQTGAPPAACHWLLGRRTSPAMPWPFHACLCHRRDLTHSQPTFPDYK